MGLAIFVGYLAVGVLVTAFLMRARWVILTAEVPDSWSDKQREVLAKRRSDGGWAGTGINSMLVVVSVVVTSLAWPLAIVMLSGSSDVERSPWMRRGRLYLVRTGRLPE